VADLERLQRRLKLRFKDTRFLEQSLIHRSYLNEALEPGVASNERMEFLGDAVLGLVIARWLYMQFPDVSEGALTEMRSYLVKGETLGVVGARLDLGSFMFLGRGEAASGGRRRQMNLARALEAVIAAVFLDRGFGVTERWLLKLMAPELEQIHDGAPPEDAKSRLQHTAQTVYNATPRYRLLRTEGPDHDKVFVIEVTLADRSMGLGKGRNKRIAEREAAEATLTLIVQEHPELVVAAE